MTTTQVLRRLIRISPPPWIRLASAVLLGVAATGATVALLATAGALADRAALRPGLGVIAGLLAVVEVLAIVRAPLRYSERLAIHDVAFRALTRWRVWLYERLEPLSPAGLMSLRSGDLSSRAIEDVDSLQDLYLRGVGPAVIAVVVSALAVTVVGLLLPPAALVLGGALIMALVVPPLLALAGAPKAAEQAIRGELMADVVDLLQGAPDLLAFGRDQDFVARAEAKGKQLARLARRRALTSGAASGLITLCIGASVVGVLALAVNAVRHHQLEGIMIAALPLAAIGAFEAVPPVAAAFVRLADVVAAGRRLLAIADIEPPVSDPLPEEEVLELPSGCPPIGMRDVRVRYGRNLPWALDGVTLDIAPGSRSALTGPSGSGKTSVINLLMRFWPFEDGTTTIAGVPLERLDQRRAREVFGLVTQDAHLFAGTIRQNVTLGRPNAGDEEISRVITLAQLGNWVDSLPLGLDTAIGEDGNRLSGGQRQRIALARALLLDAPILLLDEPTVGLDHQMADQLVSDVLAAAGERSVVLVSHRRQEAEQFDSVLELEDGRVVQRR